MILRRLCGVVIYFLVITYWYLMTPHLYHLYNGWKLMVLDWGSPGLVSFPVILGQALICKSDLTMWFQENERKKPVRVWTGGSKVKMGCFSEGGGEWPGKTMIQIQQNRWTSWTLWWQRRGVVTHGAIFLYNGTSFLLYLYFLLFSLQINRN